MDQNQQFFTGMPSPEVADSAQVQGMIQNLLKQAAQSGVLALGAFAQIQERRATRLSDAARVLGETLGDDDPETIAMGNLARSITELKTHLENQIVRLKRWPKPEPDKWMVFGNITDAQSNPASGLTVHVAARDQKLKSLLRETVTDEFGDFSVIYHERDFKGVGAELPDLYVMVSDVKGKTIFSSRDSVRYESGRSEYFTICIEIPVLEPAPKKTTTNRRKK
ncbi:MAG: hypothetical protein JXB07_07180 [Anaerolineae bacterium]|nr:hypothetical protein [Anaerolineae bacterium]